jgi:hypothetical protein
MYISRHSSQKVGQAPQLAGIDKVEMTFPLSAFTVRDHKLLGLKVNQAPGQAVPPLLVTKQGMEVTASKLYFNAPNVAGFEINHHGLKVAFNPSKIHTGHPFALLTDLAGISEVASRIMEQADKVGIDFDPMAGKLFRVDPAKQAVMHDPPAQYGQALRYARGTRMNRREYPDGHLFVNSNRELCFYDKCKELTAGRRKKAAPQLHHTVPENLLRGEVRLIGTDTIIKDTGCSTLRELVNMDPILLAGAYAKNMDRLLFNPLHSGDQLVISFTDDLGFIEDLARQHRKKAWDTYERMHGTLSLLEQLGGIDGVTRFIWALHDRGGITRSAAYRRITRLKMDLKERATLDTIRGQRSVATRLQEIRHVFTTIPQAA